MNAITIALTEQEAASALNLMQLGARSVPPNQFTSAAQAYLHLQSVITKAAAGLAAAREEKAALEVQVAVLRERERQSGGAGAQ